MEFKNGQAVKLNNDCHFDTFLFVGLDPRNKDLAVLSFTDGYSGYVSAYLNDIEAV